MFLPTQEPLIWSILSRTGSVDSSPRTGPNQIGPDTGCHCLSTWNPVESCWGLQRKWQGPERVVVGREQPTQHTRELPNANRMPGLRHPLVLISAKLRGCRARMDSRCSWGHSSSWTCLRLLCWAGSSGWTAGREGCVGPDPVSRCHVG